MNCAQAVCHGAGRDELIASMADCGGGKVAGGICGALYAAQCIVDEPQREQLTRAFIELNGASRCCELKGAQRVSCQDCVSRASSLLEQFSINKI